MPATESLTIEIQGDSSGLSQALDSALAKVESLQSATDTAASSAGSIGGRLASVATAMQPLLLVSQQLARIRQQAQLLSQQSISLNVQPALSALQSLMSAIQAVAARLSIFSQLGGGLIRGPISSGSSGGGGGTSSSGGPSTRGATNSATSTLPFAMEFTTGISTSSGHPSISNDSSVSSGNTGRTSTDSSRESDGTYSSHDQSFSTVNHFGGITIEVRETADVNALMRDLRLQGVSARHRQG